jgi:hypothetical protein
MTVISFVNIIPVQTANNSLNFNMNFIFVRLVFQLVMQTYKNGNFDSQMFCTKTEIFIKLARTKLHSRGDLA